MEKQFDFILCFVIETTYPLALIVISAYATSFKLSFFLSKPGIL